ncbi:hypothetical protein, partial [Bosea sp. (in: a-proteobacteria)]|uniref:hypothetical protein n=1 Tax=Bosea sp. (in: a-proteobacteria) TaxID=1871050 RepID=UPI004034575E
MLLQIMNIHSLHGLLACAQGHQLQQSWQLHVPATTKLPQQQQGLHWGIGDGAGKVVLVEVNAQRGA